MTTGTLRVVVTAGDIAAGKPASGLDCALAVAARRATGCDPLGVGPGGYIHTDGVTWRPTDVRRAIHFINRFDRGLPVEPCEFDYVVYERQP